jgi:hypothetical protein
VLRAARGTRVRGADSAGASRGRWLEYERCQESAWGMGERETKKAGMAFTWVVESWGTPRGRCRGSAGERRCGLAVVCSVAHMTIVPYPYIQGRRPFI